MEERGFHSDMVNEGFNCKNNHFHYDRQRVTGAGQRFCLYGRQTPSWYIGIIANDGYDKYASIKVSFIVR